MKAEYLDRPIAFQRAFVCLGIGITGALMLSQAVYWSKRTKDSEGWFYKSQEEWQEETGLGRREQETARKRLISGGFLKEHKKGVPCRLFYRVDYAAIDSALTVQTRMAESAKLECPKAPSKEGGTSHAITESTQENTSESTADIKYPAIDRSEMFEELWKSWPTGFGDKGSKKNAQSAYLKIKPDKELHSTMLTALFAQGRDKAQRSQLGEFAPNFPHVERWLKQERWNDEISSVNFSRNKPTREQRIDQALDEAFGTSDTGAIEGDFETLVSNGVDQLYDGRYSSENMG